MDTSKTMGAKPEPSAEQIAACMGEARNLLDGPPFHVSIEVKIARTIATLRAKADRLRVDLDDEQATHRAGRARLAEMVGLTGDESTRWKWLLLETAKMRNERNTLRAEVVAAGERERAAVRAGLNAAREEVDAARRWWAGQSQIEPDDEARNRDVMTADALAVVVRKIDALDEEIVAADALTPTPTGSPS